MMSQHLDTESTWNTSNISLRIFYCNDILCVHIFSYIISQNIGIGQMTADLMDEICRNIHQGTLSSSCTSSALSATAAFVFRAMGSDPTAIKKYKY